jgi:hypothetical protein
MLKTPTLGLLSVKKKAARRTHYIEVVELQGAEMDHDEQEKDETVHI